jgi:cytoskeletal protein CcmA (bactofilin family)
MGNARNLSIKGDVTAQEDLTIDFALEGTVDLPGNRLVITEDAQLNATVVAASVSVRGHVDGHISADHIEISPSAVVNAGVVTTKLALHDGAQFTGQVNTERAKAAASIAKHRQRA